MAIKIPENLCFSTYRDYFIYCFFDKRTLKINDYKLSGGESSKLYRTLIVMIVMIDAD